MKNLYLLTVILLLISSCNKDNDSEPVNPEDLRVYTAISYHDNGNILRLSRYSYDEYGMLTKEVVFYVGDSLQDTTDAMRTIYEYSMENDSTLLVLYYGENPGSRGKDTTRWIMNDDGQCIRAFKSYNAEGGLTRYALFTRAYDQDGYCRAVRSISYITDSVSDTNAVVNTTYRTILNDNCIKSEHGMLVLEYSHYTDQLNTLNYGNAFFGKSDKNPVFKSLQGNSGWVYNYEYVDEKIHKVSYEYQSAKGMESDTLYSVSMPHTTFFTYIKVKN